MADGTMANGTQATARGGVRDHSLDAARSLLMILGVPYHAALIYTPDYHWLIDSPDTIPGIGLFANFIHSFRMPAFFLISGLLIARSLRKHGPTAVLRSRATRLLVPLVAVAATVNVLQLWLATLATDPGLTLATFLTHRLPEAFRSGGLTYHLWFLVELFACMLLLCLLYPAAARLYRALRARAPRLARLFEAGDGWLPPALLSVMLVGTMGFDNISPLLLEPLPPTTSSALSTAVSASFFLVGVYVAHLAGGPTRFASTRWTVVLLYALCFLGQVGLDHVQKPMALRVLDQVLHAVGAWAAFRLLLGLALAWFARENRGVRVLSQASYSIYLLHHAVVVVAGFALLTVPWTPGVEFLLIALLGLLVPLAVHHGAVRRSPVLRFLLNGVPPGKAPGKSGTPESAAATPASRSCPAGRLPG